MHELRAVLPADRDAQKVAEARVDPLVRLVRLLNLEELKGKLRRTHELAGSLEAKSIACDTRVWYTGVVHGCGTRGQVRSWPMRVKHGGLGTLALGDSAWLFWH